MKSLIEIYKSLNDKPLHEDISEDINKDVQWLLRGEIFGKPGDYKEGTISKDSHSSLDSYKNLVKWLEDNNQEGSVEGILEDETINFKLSDNGDVEWNRVPSGPKTYGDLSPEEWEAEREKMGMKTDDEGNRYLDREYDPGNEPLEIQHSETGLTYFIDVEDIEAYVSGEEVIAVDPDRGEDAIRVTRDETDVVGVSEEELEDFLVSGDRSADDVDDDDRFSGNEDLYGADLEEGICTEQEIAEGTCGHAPDGKVDVHNTHKMKPASSNVHSGLHLNLQLQERFQKLANIKK